MPMSDLRTDDFDYELPDELIAEQPLQNRSGSRMLVVNRTENTIEHKHFSELKDYLTPEDLLILNDTKVIPARLFSNDGSIELVVVDRQSPTEWTCMVRPGKKMKVSRTVQIGATTGTVMAINPDGNRVIKWDSELNLDDHGKLALPHYMGRDAEPTDKERYQTVFANDDKEGAIAAPTAGLHFTPGVLENINHDFLTLHVGIGTFRPVKADFIKDHDMHSENYSLSQETANRINHCKKNGRLFAVGTTCTRVLESLGRENSHLTPCSGATDIFIYPPYEFKLIDGLLTNFHLPKSTLIMLVSAFAGKELTMQAYAEAVKEKYRFFSYGDCMLII